MDYARRMLNAADLIQKQARELKLVAPRASDQMSLYDALITEQQLCDTTRVLFGEGHYALAVEEAFKCLNNVVKSRTGLSNDGADLMRFTFSPKNPVLRLNALQTESQRDQQAGYMDIFAGCMTGIRNPRAHEHRYLDEERVALEMLSLANHLLSLTGKAKRTRGKRRRPVTP